MSKEYSFEMKRSNTSVLLSLISYLGIVIQDLGLSYKTAAKTIHYIFGFELVTDRDEIDGFDTLIESIHEELNEKTAEEFINYVRLIHDDLGNEG